MWGRWDHPRSVVKMSTNNIEMENEKNDNKEEEVIDTIDFSIKHPLQNNWTLWYFDNDRKNNWAKNLKEIASFSTVEDFWSLYNHIKLASEITPGCDYSLFKTGIKPMWEDDRNQYGGRWLISLDRKQRTELDRFWLDILLCMIGENFENSDDVCGATVNIRQKGDKIGLWTASYEHEDAVMEIGRKIKERLRIKTKDLIGYQKHSDSNSKGGNIIWTYNL